MADELPVASTLPDALTRRNQWLCWRRQDRDDKQTKVPIDPNTGQYASVTDSDTWTSFGIAREYVREGRADGIGFAFTEDDPIVGIDLDDCRETATGECADWAEDIIDTLDSYTEISPSGTGYHVLVVGTIPGDRSRKGGIEMYESDRFFTVTGDQVPDTPATVASRREELATVYDEYVREETAGDGDGQSPPARASTPGPTTSSPSTGDAAGTATAAAVTGLSDEELLQRAQSAANGEKFRALWRGSTTGYDSHSEADMALCSLLAFWTSGDADRMDRLFRQSGLMREKWDEVHFSDGSTYGEKTVERAIAGTDEFYEPAQEPASPESETTPSQRVSDAARTTARGTTSTTPGNDGGARLETIRNLEAELQRLEAENDDLREELDAERTRRKELEERVEDLEGGSDAPFLERLGIGL